MRATEAILVPAQNAIWAAGFAFELQHDVNEMLERLGSGEAAVFGYMPNDDGWNASALGEIHQAAGTLADLRDGARNRLELRRVHGLNRVDRQHRRPTLAREA